MDRLRLTDRPAVYDRVDGVLFLSSSDRTQERQSLLLQSLRGTGRPVIIANADLAASREDGFTLEPGHFRHHLVDEEINSVRFFGNPFREVYELAGQSLPGVPPDRIVMCGDTLHTEFLGAAARNWRTVLVTRDGLLSGYDMRIFCERSGLYPDWRLARI